VHCTVVRPINVFTHAALTHTLMSNNKHSVSASAESVNELSADFRIRPNVWYTVSA